MKIRAKYGRIKSLNQLIFTFVSSSQPESHQRADDTKYLDREEGVDLPSVGIGPQELEAFPAGNDDFLLLGPAEAPVHCVGDPRRTLQGQVVQIHRALLGSPSV